MSASATPFGFIANRHTQGAIVRATAYTIAAAYATAIYKGAPCILATDGTIQGGAAAADIIGIFAGVEYVDATGKPVVTTFWPAGGVAGATNIRAWVYDDPGIEFLVQSGGSVVQASVGDQADVANVGNNANGMSTCQLSTSLAGVGIQAQFRITGFDLGLDNAPGDAFTKVLVKIARHQLVANKVAL